MPSWLTSIDDSLGKSVIVLIAVAMVAALDLTERMRHKKTHYVFGCLLGSILALGFIHLAHILFSVQGAVNGYAMAFGILVMIIAWRLLFGPWEAHVKATVLGTCVFWISLHILFREPMSVRLTHLFAIAVALVPAVVWCMLFLPYHKEKLSRVFLMFFAGMLSTAPILIYDALVRSRTDLEFFFFSITPQSFNTSTQSFVQGYLQASDPINATLLTFFLSFVCVGVIEEASKYWVLTKSGRGMFSSIDEVIELSIIVAIGFAFAENILNSGYFVAFVRQYLIEPEHKDWLGFFGNIAGRSVLTSMVHIVSTGLLGAFVGRAIFAKSLLNQADLRNKHVTIVDAVTGALGMSRMAVYRVQMIMAGFIVSILLHAFANFMVTLPDVLPGNPQTIGDLLGVPDSSPLHFVSLILFPCLLYVVGGFWLLTWLFERKENVEERGRVVVDEVLVRDTEAVA